MSIARILIPATTLVIGLTAGLVTGVAAALAAEHEKNGWCAEAANQVFGPKKAKENPEAAPEKVEAPAEAIDDVEAEVEAAETESNNQ